MKSRKPLFVILLFLFLTYAISPKSIAQETVSTEILKTNTTWNNQKIEYPDTESPEITALHMKFAPGSQTVWHRHPLPSLAYIMSGELEVTVKESGETKIFRKGDAFAEVINTWHHGKVIGDEQVELVVFYIGGKGLKLTELLSEIENADR